MLKKLTNSTIKHEIKERTASIPPCYYSCMAECFPGEPNTSEWYRYNLDDVLNTY